MKLTTSFALLALTAAIDPVDLLNPLHPLSGLGSAAQEPAAAQDPGYGSAAQKPAETQDTGYEAGQGAGQGYEAAPSEYQPAAWSPPVKTCFGNCPSHAHCAHKETGACVAPIRSYEAPSQYWANDNQYSNDMAAPAATYDSQGRLLEASYGQAQSYGQESNEPRQEYSEPRHHSSCPSGTVNMNCRRLGSRVALWVGFGCLFAPALYFFMLAFNDPGLEAVKDWAKVHHFLDFDSAVEAVSSAKLVRFTSGIICFVASLAYLTMALGYGYTTRCCDGRQFYYARYIDWAITTPMMIWEIIERTDCADHERFFLIGMDILMIVAGLIGSLVCGSSKWVFFGFSMLCFLPIMYFICDFKSSVRNSIFKGNYENAVNLTLLVWCGYPIVWILSEGTGTICSQAEAIIYTVLDIIAKSGLGLILTSRAALWRETGGAIVADVSSMI